MEEENFLKNVNQDLFSIAVDEYTKYRYSDEYDAAWKEDYKYEILEDLNQELSLEQVTSENIVSVVEKLQDANPSTGSFVHWSNLDDLKKFAEAKPNEVLELFQNLFNEDDPLNERITAFRSQGREFDSNISLGTPLFGYLLAAFGRNKYTLFKGDPFRNFAEWFDYDVPSNLGEKYEKYLNICKELRTHFNENEILEKEEAELLDSQDFIYSISEYPALTFKIAVSYLSDFSAELASYKENPENFLEKIKQMDKEFLVEKMEEYTDSKKIRKIRYQILDKILKDPNSVSLDTLKDIMDRVSSNYEENILKSWDEFKILFEIYFANYKTPVNALLGSVHEILREKLTEEEFTPGKVINDFSWNQNFGSTRAGIILFPNRNKSHRDSGQLLLDFKGGKLRYGLYLGDKVKTSQSEDLVEKDNPEYFYLEDVVDKLKSVLPIYREVNKKYWKISPGSGASQWENFLEGNYIAINWDELDYPEKDIHEQAEEENLELDPDYVEKQFEYFTKEMKQGDIVLAYGNTKILGIGKIVGGYYKEESLELFPHRREVEWLHINEFKAEELGEDFYERVRLNRTILLLDEQEFIEKIKSRIESTSYYWLTTSVKDLGLAGKLLVTGLLLVRLILKALIDE